jgi:6-phosphogluconolactonase (cycloisomerase 2 family)
MVTEALTILVGSYTNAVYTLSFSPSSSSLVLKSSLDVGFHPSWLAVVPSKNLPSEHKAIILTGLEQTDGKIVAIRLDEEGKATKLGEVPSGGADPASLAVHPSGDEVVIGNVRAY